MITFRHKGNTASIAPGQLWVPPTTTADTYRDTPTSELMEIVRAIEAGQPWRKVVSARFEKFNPWLYQIISSPKRDLFLRQNPPKPHAKVLDIGSGWGQIALPLARSGAEIIALEPTPERLAFIRAAARQERIDGSLYFMQADFFDVDFEPRFDLITCIGVLEWIAKFRAGDPGELQLAFLRRARAALAPGGRLVIGIENRLGLKYLLGAPDDHIGVPQIAVYDPALASGKWQKHAGQPLRSFTFTRAELDTLLRAAGFDRTEFFAALPDYKLPEVILPLGKPVDEHFLTNNFIAEHDGCNGSPLAFQAELRSHYRSLAQLGIASDFAPSFLVAAS